MARIETDLAKAYLWRRQQNLKRTAATALQLARKDVAAGKKRYPHSSSYHSGGTWGDGGAYYCDNWPDGWREVGTAADVCRGEHSRRVDHDGWYTDDMQSETMQGFVLQLPARKGIPRYVPGTFHSRSDGVTLYPRDVTDDILDCSSLADDRARFAAEKERDYNEAWHQGNNVAGMLDDVATIRRKLLAEFAKYRAAKRESTSMVVLDYLRETMRDSAEESCDEIRELRDEMDKIRDSIPTSLMDAFNDGFGQ